MRSLPSDCFHRTFHEYPHPENWEALVEVLHSRFGTNGEGIPLEMCPCGNRKATLRRFLVARRYVVDDAEKMLRDTIEWRTNVTIGGVKGVELILKSKPRWDLIAANRRIIPATPLHCYTRQGYPVYALRLGKGDSSLATSVHEECHVYSSIIRGEHLVRKILPDAQSCYQNSHVGPGVDDPTSGCKESQTLPESPRAVVVEDSIDIFDKQVVIVDLEGIGMSALRCLYVFKVINSVASLNYPELSKAIYIVNAPSIFDYLWSAVKPLLASHTQNKIRIYQSCAQQYEALREILIEDDIPDYLTPQENSGITRGRPGCVTESEYPGYRPEGVKHMDLWIESMSQDSSKECPFA